MNNNTEKTMNEEVDTVHEKLKDSLTPGYEAEFDPEEAEAAGAFMEDALSEQDAEESNIDLIDNKEE